MPCYCALIEYDGTAYKGFQRQRPGQSSIQETVEQALTLITGQTVPILGSGRTDSGVHALGQVITFNLHWAHDLAALQRALNANLPADIAVLKLRAMTADFHPRYDARKRTYHYHIYNQQTRSPLRRWRSWHVSAPLDLEQMNVAAQAIVGTHNFATFGRPPQGDNTVRTVYLAQWQQQGEVLVFRITANAFLYRMVRSLVGSLKLVGTGVWSVAEFVAAWQAGDRRRCGALAPAHGLYLVSVEYEDELWTVNADADRGFLTVGEGA